MRRPAIRIILPRATRRVLALLLAIPASAAAQSPASATPTWRVGSSATASLLFDALAPHAPARRGALPLYDARAAAAPADATLRAALLADASLELLHFLPVHLADAPPEAVLDALEPPGDAGALAPTHARVLRTSRALLAGEPRAAALGRLGTVAARRWRGGFAEAWRAGDARRASRHAALQARWEATFAPALGAYLRGAGMERGDILLVPAVGHEGRLLHARGSATGRTIVVVHDGALGGVDEAPLHLAVREMCFPAVRAASARAGTLGGPDAGDRAAVRCGELLLRGTAPALADDYVRVFLAAARAAGLSRAAEARTLDAAYPLAPPELRALERETRRLATSFPPS